MTTLEEFRAIVDDRSRPASSRAWALWALRLLNDKAIRGKLPMLLAERPSSRLFLWEVAKTVVAVRPPRVTAVVQEMLREEDWSLREIAAWLLGFVGSNASRSALESALAEDLDAAVRAQAAESLGTLGSRQSVSALIDALRDRSARVRYFAAHALAEIGDPSALSALRERLNDRSSVNATTIGAEVRRAIRKLNAAS
jgi:hypothetical protein